MVDHDQVAAGRVGRQVARLAAVGGLAAQEAQLAAVLVDGVRGDLAVALAGELAVLVDGEEEPLARIERQERGVAVLDDVQLGQAAGLGIVAEEVDALAAPGAGVGPDVDEIRLHDAPLLSPLAWRGDGPSR